jgi:DNA repair protein RecO (recombination protein O)
LSPVFSRRLKVPHRTEALLLRQVTYGEADVIVTLLTRDLGKVSAMARNLRRAKPRPTVVLEPIHTLLVALDESPGVEMMVLREARLERVRHRLTRRLDALDAAGQGLRWVRALAPPRAPEPGIWVEIENFLDLLDGDGPQPPERVELAGLGLRLLRGVGYGFELRACARCGKPCPPGSPARFDPRQGGLICTACGGPLVLPPALRQALVLAEEGDSSSLPAAEAEAALGWIDVALVAHLSVGEQPSLETGKIMTDHVFASRPVRVRAPKGARVFEIHWADGLVGKIPHELLRGYCPCATCQGHSGTIRFVAGGDLELEEITPVGNYALQLTWGDRHDTGLYSFRYLRALSDVAMDPERAGDERPELPRL